MSETVNLELKADPSEAKEALQQVNKSLKEGKEAAEALNHVLDGDLAGAFKSLGELSKTLGIDLGLAFSPAEIIAFAQVVAEVADKLSKLIADTYIYTDAMKEEDKALASANKSLEASAARVKALGRETQIAAEKSEAGKEKLRLQFKLEDLGGDPKALKAKMDEAIADLASARAQAAKLEKDGPSFGRPEDGTAVAPDQAIAEFNQKVEESDAKIAKLENTINAYAAAIRVADAETKRTGQIIANDLAEQAAATSQAEISAGQRRKEAVLALEREKWNAIKGLVKTTAEENERIETGFENRSYQIQREALEARLRLAKQDNNTAQTVTINSQLQVLATNHEATLTKIRAQGVAERHKLEDQQSATLAKQSSDALAQVKAENDAIIKGADEQFQVWDEGYKGQIEVAKIASETKIQLITQDFEKGKITQQQEIALIAQEKERELEIEKLTQQKRWALWDGDKKKQQEVQNQIDKIIAQSKQVQTKAVTDGLKAQEQQYKQVFSQIGNSFKTEILGMIQGTETVAQGFAKMFNSLISSFADYVAQKAEKKAEEWLIDKLFTEKKIGSETAAATGIASMAGFASAMQALPFPINVSMAPAVAAAAGATASGMGAIAMGAASLAIGTDYVPMDGLAYLHKGEKVIPASMQGPGYSGGAGITIVVNHSVSAVDAASFQGHIRRHSNMIANEVTRALKRKGAR